MIRCMICGLDPATDDGAAVYRLNNRGLTGVWACRPHFAYAKAKYFPDDDPEAPAPPRPDSGRPLGPWTGGTTKARG